MKRSGSTTDPLWYKDAIIYELHVRAFMDSNNDGIGDLQGLTQKLDYLQDLGVTCLWLLPFFPSPLRDDGYDISDYLNIHPNYGTIADFQQFLDQAHNRGLQVLIELVINHTSDQHPWFQRARHAPKGSPERDFYVWSDTDQKYQGARIIFTDTEKSNWTWDPEAQAYYWHRFFSHQPDLNYDNPQVLEEVLKIMRYWLDMGVDGLRVDAIPYLVEREGTNCENLPETHAIMKRIRQEIDQEYFGRMMLAEANQWPTDVRPYYGDGDECHMAFHFPLMPRIYMALRQEDRLPITEIMAQTPSIPDNCQWGLFLRNHDELTLEMVTDEERDYMYLAYSADPRMRINIGIRRRLAPLVDNNRRRIELLNSLLFSFPGTPLIYYGDEIGMGDNIYLGDRNGVRTPMQWSPDRNAGFSRAVPAKLYSPVVMDPVWGYEAINVEAQQSDPSSLLSWMRNMIALRKLFQVFGRGTLTFLNPANRKVLAYVREFENQRVLCVANLSRFAQPVELDLEPYAGMSPVEMLGYVPFPKIPRHAANQQYPLTLGPYGFLWLELQAPVVGMGDDEAIEEPEIALSGATDWKSVLEGNGQREIEETVLKDFLPHQRWFGSKARTIKAIKVTDWAAFHEGGSALALIDVSYASGDAESYLLALALTFGRAAEELRQRHPESVLARLSSIEEDGVLHDGLVDPGTVEALLALITEAGELTSRHGNIRGVPSTILENLRGTAPLAPRLGSAEQSNTSVIFGDRLILKLFRRQQPGPNPDTEIGRYLTEYAHFPNIAPFSGSIEYKCEGQDGSTLAMLQGLVANEGDGWQWTLEELDRYYESTASRALRPEHMPPARPSLSRLSEEPEPALAHEHMGIYLSAAALLGTRTAEMHLALARNGMSAVEDPSFAPEPMTLQDMERLRDSLVEHAAQAFDALKENLSRLPDAAVELAGLVLSRRRAALDRLRQIAGGEIHALRTRIHGDYHLGQVLRTKGDFVILDFEGEPARSLAERRAKQSPLKDVAGMLRSFSYAAFSALMRYSSRRPEAFEQLEPWARMWEQAASSVFLRSYRESIGGASLAPCEPSQFERLLEAFLLDKALYELVYELNNRPSWVRIPLSGILSLPL
ncbi:MAG TPA: maltose alpha-D-glucosyltransferase [Acidobacteriaceae bacterium]|nr:maltose alpha-D-glucosyltransferase [Acidobacteriaceae bacterium]